jgi:hypothetical protein
MPDPIVEFGIDNETIAANWCRVKPSPNRSLHSPFLPEPPAIGDNGRHSMEPGPIASEVCSPSA